MTKGNQKCSIHDCQNRDWARGYCHKHLARFYKYSDPNYTKPSFQGKFWSKVSRSGGCFEWTSSLTSDGYGKVWDGSKTRLAHRVAYEFANGKIPNGLEIDHLCRNRRCVNPDHLEAVTAKINSQRSLSVSGVNFRKTHCQKGHVFDQVNKNGHKICTQCRRDVCKEHYYKNRESILAHKKKMYRAKSK